jgi:tetratricopeptide (TPR) repeat protein
LGDAAAAVASIEKAIASVPARAPDAQINLANALFDAGRHAESIGHYDNALAAAPDDAGAMDLPPGQRANRGRSAGVRAAVWV